MAATLQSKFDASNSRKPDAEREILNLIAEWRRALEARDLDALVADYLPDSTLYDVKPPYKLVGPAAIRQAWEQCLPFFPKAFRSEHRDLEVVVSDDAAFVYGLHRMVPIDEPDHPAGQTWVRVTACYRRIDGRWRTVHEHVSIPFDCSTGQVAPITST